MSKNEEKMEKREDIIKDIEKVLGGHGYARFIQPALPGERRIACVKDNEVIIINNIFEANDMQIRSIKSLYKTALIEGRDMAKEIRKKIEENKGH